MSPDLFSLAADLEAARGQMAFTLGFRIVLACIGVAFPAGILIAIQERAGASETLTAVLVVFGVAVVVVLPALALLFTLDQRSVLEEEVESAAKR